MRKLTTILVIIFISLTSTVAFATFDNLQKLPEPINDAQTNQVGFVPNQVEDFAVIDTDQNTLLETKKENGNWSTPSEIPLNTAYNNYPFLSLDGKDLYYYGCQGYVPSTDCGIYKVERKRFFKCSNY